MPQISGFLDLMDARSFGVVWYWVALAWVWTRAGRRVLGVPREVIAAARRSLNSPTPEPPEAVALLDWLSLNLPRWQPTPVERAVLVGIGGFGLGGLWALGAGLGLELALAASLLLTPLALLWLLNLWLAARLARLLNSAEPLRDIATQAARRMVWHSRLVFALGVISVMATAMVGAIWRLLHPFGI
ncbi:MAG: hypothetical protein Q4G24_09125 [Paracoccus sp. (in: a-proteobacteria)]|uniref:hypothetical protein n=1 Tax=Paracoccus sp. TaxID=267 RepID=UPI0026DEF405|nr:hypothetical protein [Paracoccus sp. (in: a-proteobacteria)]MDO5621616.1 hypothetical protein [Paracoccus sp. (in: a-proteobacteria)]